MKYHAQSESKEKQAAVVDIKLRAIHGNALRPKLKIVFPYYHEEAEIFFLNFHINFYLRLIITIHIEAIVPIQSNRRRLISVVT